MVTLFITLQIILFFIMIFHDWISIPPINDVATLKKIDGNRKRFYDSIMNGSFVLIPLILTLVYRNNFPLIIISIIIAFYLILTIGTILSWWVPYFFGSSLEHRTRFQKFSNTHHFLPKIKEHVVPNTLHVVLHLIVWTCLLLAILLICTVK